MGAPMTPRYHGRPSFLRIPVQTRLIISLLHALRRCIPSQSQLIRFRNRHHRHLQTKPSSPVNTAPHNKTQINPQIPHLRYMNNRLSPHNLTLKPDSQYYRNNLTKLTPCPNPSPIQRTAVDPCSTENTDPENSTSTKNPLFSYTPNQIRRKPRHRCNKQHEP
jgi:hypothetical protein